MPDTRSSRYPGGARRRLKKDPEALRDAARQEGKRALDCLAEGDAEGFDQALAVGVQLSRLADQCDTVMTSEADRPYAAYLEAKHARPAGCGIALVRSRGRSLNRATRSTRTTCVNRSRRTRTTTTRNTTSSTSAPSDPDPPGPSSPPAPPRFRIGHSTLAQSRLRWISPACLGRWGGDDR